MMYVYRISGANHANDLTGTGARLAGGRWNRRGIPVLYTSSSRALATLEVLVHIPVAYIPKEYRLLTIQIPEDSITSIPLNDLPDNWDSLTPLPELTFYSENWIQENRYLCLKVPSAIVQGEYNFLINPLHSRFNQVMIVQNEPYRFDPRLLH